MSLDFLALSYIDGPFLDALNPYERFHENEVGYLLALEAADEMHFLIVHDDVEVPF